MTMEDLKHQHYKVNLVKGDHSLDPIDDNVDVEVVFDDGRRYVATFFTLRNLESLFRKYEETGECERGLYFWASDMIIVRRLTKENIAKSVADLISNGEFEQAFSGPHRS